jgi:hypothetical protein
MWGNRPTVTGLAVSTTTVMALGVGSVALVGGQSALRADTQSAARGAQQAQVQQAQAAPGGVRAEPDGHGWGKASRVLHGEFVVPKRGGGYETVRIQRGSLQSASSTEITLRSADGYRQTYRLGSDTVVNAGSTGLRSIGRGDMVSVAATVTGHSATALYVADISHLRSAFEKHAPSSPDHSGMGGAGG